MKKYLFAAAAAGGILLFAAAPAQADVLPAPTGAQGGLLDGLIDPAGNVSPANGLSVDNPLGGKLLDMKPGKAGIDLQDSNVLPRESGAPAARTGLGGAAPADQRPTRVTGQSSSSSRPGSSPLPVGGGALGGGALGGLPVSNLLSGGLPLIGGLMPSGRATTTAPGNTESGLLGGGIPLLGGLGGLLPEDGPTTLPADAGDPVASGMPGGGTAVPPATDPGGTDDTDPVLTDPAPADAPGDAKPADTKPGDAKPGTAKPGVAGPGDDAKRLHEEPIDNEASSNRKFSDGRPVAGSDPDFQ